MEKSSPSAVGVRASKAGRRTLGVSVLVVLFAAIAAACQPGVIVATIGDGSSGNTGDGLLGTSAQLVRPGTIAPIPGGGYYVADTGVCGIRKIGSNGRMSTLAGTGTCYPTNGVDLPFGPNSDAAGQMALDASGNLYVADFHANAIRRISTDGTITTIPGPGGPGEEQVNGVAISSTGSILVNRGAAVYELLPDGSYQPIIRYPSGNMITSLKTGADGNMYLSVVNLTFDPVTGAAATTSTVQRLNPGTGSATVVTTAGLGLPPITDVAVAADGTVYAAFGSLSLLGDHYLVGRMTADGVVIIAGNGDPDPGNAAQTGVGTEASISPTGIAIAPNGTLLISSGHVVYRLNAPASAGTGAPSTSLVGN